MQQVVEDLECQGQDWRTLPCGEDSTLWGALQRLDRVPKRRALKDECSGGGEVEFQAEGTA